MTMDLMDMVYGDLPDCDLNIDVKKLQEENLNLHTSINQIQSNISKVLNEIHSCKKTHENLTKNLSKLYETAKKEIEGKNQQIQHLRNELENLTFRRNTVPDNSNSNRTLKRNLLDDSSSNCDKFESKRLKFGRNYSNRSNNYENFERNSYMARMSNNQRFPSNNTTNKRTINDQQKGINRMNEIKNNRFASFDQSRRLEIEIIKLNPRNEQKTEIDKNSSNNKLDQQSLINKQSMKSLEKTTIVENSQNKDNKEKGKIVINQGQFNNKTQLLIVEEDDEKYTNELIVQDCLKSIIQNVIENEVITNLEAMENSPIKESESEFQIKDLTELNQNRNQSNINKEVPNNHELSSRNKNENSKQNQKSMNENPRENQEKSPVRKKLKTTNKSSNIDNTIIETTVENLTKIQDEELVDKSNERKRGRKKKSTSPNQHYKIKLKSPLKKKSPIKRSNRKLHASKESNKEESLENSNNQQTNNKREKTQRKTNKNSNKINDDLILKRETEVKTYSSEYRKSFENKTQIEETEINDKKSDSKEESSNQMKDDKINHEENKTTEVPEKIEKETNREENEEKINHEKNNKKITKSIEIFKVEKNEKMNKSRPDIKPKHNNKTLDNFIEITKIDGKCRNNETEDKNNKIINQSNTRITNNLSNSDKNVGNVTKRRRVKLFEKIEIKSNKKLNETENFDNHRSNSPDLFEKDNEGIWNKSENRASINENIVNGKTEKKMSEKLEINISKVELKINEKSVDLNQNKSDKEKNRSKSENQDINNKNLIENNINGKRDKNRYKRRMTITEEIDKKSDENKTNLTKNNNEKSMNLFNNSLKDDSINKLIEIDNKSRKIEEQIDENKQGRNEKSRLSLNKQPREKNRNLTINQEKSEKKLKENEISEINTKTEIKSRIDNNSDRKEIQENQKRENKFVNENDEKLLKEKQLNKSEISDTKIEGGIETDEITKIFNPSSVFLSLSNDNSNKSINNNLTILSPSSIRKKSSPTINKQLKIVDDEKVPLSNEFKIDGVNKLNTEQSTNSSKPKSNNSLYNYKKKIIKDLEQVDKDKKENDKSDNNGRVLRSMKNKESNRISYNEKDSNTDDSSLSNNERNCLSNSSNNITLDLRFPATSSSASSSSSETAVADISTDTITNDKNVSISSSILNNTTLVVNCNGGMVTSTPLVPNSNNLQTVNKLNVQNDKIVLNVDKISNLSTNSNSSVNTIKNNETTKLSITSNNSTKVIRKRPRCILVMKD